MADPASIKSGLLSAFRDFEVEGVPASGVQEPVKAEVRAALGGLADRVEEVGASALQGVKGYAALADLPVLTSADDGALAKVEETGLVYRWDGDSWETFDDPTLSAAQVALDAAGRAEAAAAETGGLIGEQVGELTLLQDENGFGVLGIDEAGQILTGHANLMAGAEPFEIADEHGFVLMAVSPDGLLVSPPAQNETAWDAEPLFGGLLCGVSGAGTHIYLRNLMPQRSDEAHARGVFASNGASDGSRMTYVVTGDDDLPLDLSRAGPTAVLSLRAAGKDSGLRNALNLLVAQAPNPIPAAAPSILMIGDSITNRGMAQLVKNRLSAWGATATMVGTLIGSAEGSASTVMDGDLGEGREGWEFGDHTYAVTDRAQIIAPGDEAAYLAMAKDQAREYNPFVRAATGGDPGEFVKNGHIFDFGFYLSRFSIAAPDIVMIGLGTNDIRDRVAEGLAEAVTDNLSIMHQQIRAAAPAARIFIWFPPAPRSPDRDALWAEKYVPLIRALIAYQRGAADPGLFIVPAWAMASQEVGWRLLDPAADPATGVASSTLADDVHPVDVARQQIAEVLASYIACAAANLI